MPDWLNFSSNTNGTATLTGTPDNSSVGRHEVVLSVSDGNLSSEQRFNIDVKNVNDAPFFVTNPLTGAQIGKVYSYSIEVDDVDKNDELTIEVIRKPEWLTFKNTGVKRAELSGTPIEEHSGSHQIVLRVKDKANASAEQEYYLIINQQPVVTNSSIAIDEDITHHFSFDYFKDHFLDINQLALQKIRIVEVPANGHLEVNGKMVNQNNEIDANALSQLIYIPGADYNGQDQFNWMGSNGTEYSSNFAIISIDIAPVDDTPRILNMETAPLAYVPGKDNEKNISTTVEIVEPDGQKIVGAQVIFNPRSFLPEQDILIFESMNNITGVYSRTAGILTLLGEATDEVYQNAIRSVKYKNTSINPSYEIREFNVYVDDGTASSNFSKRDIQLIDGLVELGIPSAITPNGDGINDTWNIKNLELYPESFIKIFNRNGQEVFTASFDQSWDGKYNGEDLPAGTYFYLIDLVTLSKVYSGTVTLLR